MVRGYEPDELKQKLVEVLTDSETGLSGVEISEKLGVNRVTMVKYLSIFAAEGLIRQKKIGNVTLWFIEKGTQQFKFPDDYFKVKEIYEELLFDRKDQAVYNLVRNCIFSNAKTELIMSEIIVPAIESVQELYQQGKIGKSEEKFLRGVISNSIKILTLLPKEINPEKNVIIISADLQNALRSEAASATFHSFGWRVFSLGDMSGAIDVLFDLDLQKFLSKTWKPKKGIMLVVVFSNSEKELKFFSEAVNSVKKKYGKSLNLLLYSKNKKTAAKGDYVTDDLETALQWAETISERFIGKGK